MTFCFPKLRLPRPITGCWLFLDMTAWIDTYNKHVVSCVPSSASFSSPSWGVSVVCNSRLNSNQTQGPSSAVTLSSICHAGRISARGIWAPTSFNDWATPVVPVTKAAQTSSKPALRVCSDYSVADNPQLDTHRHP